MGDRAKIQKPPIDEPQSVRPQGASSDLPTVEQSRRVRMEKFQRLLDNVPIAMVMTGPHGNFEYVNLGFVRLFGYGADEVPNGKQWSNLAFPDPQRKHLRIKYRGVHIAGLFVFDLGTTAKKAACPTDICPAYPMSRSRLTAIIT